MKKTIALLLFLALLLTAALPAWAEDAASRRITLSGKAEETFTAEQNCYAEGERALVFIQKGLTLPCDVITTVEGAMAELEAATGLSFDTRWSISHTNNYEILYEEDVFGNVNPDGGKIEVLVAALPGWSPWATENSAIIDVIDLVGDDKLALYHELAHVLYLRNAADLGLCLDEGLATWTVDQIFRRTGIPCYTTDWYMSDVDFDTALITGGEDSFSINFENSDDNYRYGYRFVTFLVETYGKEIIPGLLKAVTDSGFDSSYGEDEAADRKADSEQMKTILRTLCGEDVFERFAKWHESEMPRVREEYRDYMQALDAA